MRNIRELQHLPAPGARPQPLAYHNRYLWSGSWETNRLYGIDPRGWIVDQEIAAPGRPYGLTSFDGAIYAVIALGDDDRYLFRCTPGRGFEESSKRACPDFTGSHLASDGKRLYLSQQGKHRILVIDKEGNVEREIALATRCAGLGFNTKGECYMISGNAELKNLRFSRLQFDGEDAEDKPLAVVPFNARALAYDGKNWWTSHRDQTEIVCFSQ